MCAENYDYQSNLVQSIFQRWVDNYLIGDLEVLLKLPSPENDEEGGGCSAPLAMAVFSGMDLFGYLTRRGSEPDRSKRMHPNIKCFCNEWMRHINPVYKSEKLQEAFIHLFRCGAAHYFFPIGIHITRSRKCDKLMKPSPRGAILSVQILGHDFKDALELLSAKVAKASNTELIQIMYDKLMMMKDEYSQDIVQYLPPALEKVIPSHDQYLDPTVGSGDLTWQTTWTTSKTTMGTTTAAGTQAGAVPMTIDWGSIMRQMGDLDESK